MVILAGIIITAAVADGGVIDRAKLAMQEQERADVQEIIISSYIYDATATTGNTYAFIDLEKTAGAIFDNLTSNGFEIVGADEVSDFYTPGDTEIDLEVKGDHGIYEGTVDKEGLTDEGIKHKGEMTDLDKLREYFVGNVILDYSDYSGLIDVSKYKFANNHDLNDAELIEFDPTSVGDPAIGTTTEVAFKYKNVNYILVFKTEQIPEKTEKWIIGVSVNVDDETTIEKLEKIALNNTFTNVIQGDYGITYKSSIDNIIIVEFKGEIFGLTCDTTSYVVTKVDYSNWKTFGDENEYFLVEKNGTNVNITGLTEKGIQDIKSNHKLNIPAKISASDGITEVVDYPVIGIKENSFQSVLTDVHTLTFDEDIQIQSINGETFRWMENLTGTLKIPASIITIESHAFNGTSITKLEFEENSKLKTIGDFSFTTKENSLTGELTIPASVEEIGESGFWGTTITSLTFEEGSKLKKIGSIAFSECKLLTNVINIPSTCETIDEYAFANSGITGVKFNGPISIGDSAFYNCLSLAGELYLYDETFLGDNCFYSSVDNLTKISISPNVSRYRSGLQTFDYDGSTSKWFVEYRGTFEQFRQQNILDNAGNIIAPSVDPTGLKIVATDGTYVHGVDFEWK